ncbi:MAG: hypothetical protein GY941_14105, partial [Planctomycetes bacterium]|nr:hypothetical protein [Planctomycetota bacterium]
QQAIKYGFVQAFMVATGEPDADDGPRTRPVDHVWAILAGLEPVDTKTVFDRLWAGISDGDPADMDAGQAALLLVNYWRGTADE